MTTVEIEYHERFARTALGLYSHEAEFEIAIPEGYDEVAIATAFRDQGCELTYLTPRRTIIVAP